MNRLDDLHAVNGLFVDLNAFFASCGQQENPRQQEPARIVCQYSDGRRMVLSVK